MPRLGVHFMQTTKIFAAIVLVVCINFTLAQNIQADAPAESAAPNAEIEVFLWVSANSSSQITECGSTRETACSLAIAMRKVNSLERATLMLESGIYLMGSSTQMVATINGVLTIRNADFPVGRVQFRPEREAMFPRSALVLSRGHFRLEGLLFEDFEFTPLSISIISSAELIDCEFDWNSGSSLAGPAILSASINVSFVRCSFDTNSGYDDSRQNGQGGAVSILIEPSPSRARNITVSFESCVFMGNSISGHSNVERAAGGALSVLFEQQDTVSENPNSHFYLIISNSIFSKNELHIEGTDSRYLDRAAAPQLRGGAIHVDVTCILHFKIENTSFVNNSIVVLGIKADAVFGGAVDVSARHPNSLVEVVNSVWERNVASAGMTKITEEPSAGICAGGALNLYTASSLHVRNSRFIGNTCFGAFGGLFAGPVSGGAISFAVPPGEDIFEFGPAILVDSSEFISNTLLSSASDPIASSSTAMGGAVAIALSQASIVRELEFNNSTFLFNKVFANCKHASTVRGAAVSVYSNLPTKDPDIIFLLKNITIVGNLFSNNTLTVECASFSGPLTELEGGALYMKFGASCFGGAAILARNTFEFNQAGVDRSDYEKSKFEAVAGAAYVNFRSQQGIVIDQCTFTSNSVIAGTIGTGGAVYLFTNAPATIRNSAFVQNSVICYGITKIKLLNCGGGAVYTIISTKTIVENSTFESNSVFSPGRCNNGIGGAIFTRSPLVASDTTFTSNSIYAFEAFGGAIGAPDVDLRGCTFTQDHVACVSSGAGGAVISQSGSVSINNTSFNSCGVFRRSPTRNRGGGLDLNCDPNSIIWPLGARLFGPDLSGGALALFGTTEFNLLQTTFYNSSAHFGGSISFSRPRWYSHASWNLVDVIIAETSARRGAGGAMFAFNTCYGEIISTICSLESVHITNSTASLYGPICATAPSHIEFVQPPPKFVAPGQEFEVSLVLKDELNSTVLGVQDPFTASLLYSSDVKTTFFSGIAQDSVFSDDFGVYLFSSLVISGLDSSNVTLGFSTQTGLICERNYMNLKPLGKATVVANFTTTWCPPSYFDTSDLDRLDSPVRCELCPPQTYLLPSSGDSKCKPCNEEEGGEHSGGERPEEEAYSCLTPPRVAEESRKSGSTWTVAAGFYPVPTLDAPTMILPCPNHACKPFECQAYVDRELDWNINCTACPHAHSNVNTNETAEDCHCHVGYADRLCSRCSCNADVCYFATGSEELHCTLCRQRSTLLIVAAIAALQVSLVIFLVFKRSALALLLSEAVIVIILLALGIGEAWMFELVLILGLLFVITSVGAKKPSGASSSACDEIEETEHESHREEAGRTAALAKVVIFFFQTLASVVKHSAWPSWISTVMRQLDGLNLRVSGVECFAPNLLSNPVAKLAFQLAMPWILGANIVVAALLAATLMNVNPVRRIRDCFAFISSKCGRKRGKKSIPSAPASSESEQEESSRFLIDNYLVEEKPVSLEPHGSEENSEEWVLSSLLNTVIFSFLFLISASYFELSNLVLEVLRPCQHGYMASFPWIPCSFQNGSFSTLYGLGIGFLLLYTFGIPAAFGSIMFWHRRRILAEDPQIEARFGFLFEAYRPKLYWWELVWFLRRILLSVAQTLLIGLPAMQMILIMSVLIGSLFLHRSAKPFLSKAGNMMDLAATATILFSVVMGTQLNHSDKSVITKMAQNIVWSIAALVSGVILIFLILPALKSFIAWCRKLSRRKL